MTTMARQLPLLIAVASMFAACGAQAGDRSPGPGMGLTPVNKGLPTVSAEEESRALEALQEEPTFQRVTTDVEWNIAEALPNGGDIEHIDFALIVELNPPVNSDEPNGTGPSAR